jgi:hypothetical protein
MPEREDRGLDDIQERLRGLERELFPGSAETPRHRAGIRVSDWFLPTDLAWRVVVTPAASRGDLGFLPAFSRGRVLKALLLRRRDPWRLRADAVAINKNCRVFFLAEKLTVKANFSGMARHDPILREIEAREAVRPTSRARIPEILRHGTTAEGTYFVERMIAGGARVDPGFGENDLAEALFEFYAANGMIAKPLGEVASAEPWQADAAEALNGAGFAVTEIEKVQESIGRIFGNDVARPVLWGLCHGDLSFGNMLRVEGQIFLLDWEEAHQGLIYGDLCKLFAAAPALEARFDALSREFCGGDCAIAAQKLLAKVALAHKLFRESEKGRQAKKLGKLREVAQSLVAETATPVGGSRQD